MSNEELEYLKIAIHNNDVHAYERLFKLAYPILKRYIGKFINDIQNVEEIASDVLINIWNKRNEITNIIYFRAYIYTAARNASLNHLRNNNQLSNHINYDELSPIIVNYTPETAYITSELRNKIFHAIEQLPPKCRNCFQLIKEEGLSYKETAEILGISVKTVDAQLVIAIKKIATAIAPVLK